MPNSGWPPRLPDWPEIKRALGVKTLYLSALLGVLGVAGIVVGASPTFSDAPPAALPVWAVISAGIGTTLLTSAVFSFISETMVRLDTFDFFESEFRAIRALGTNAATPKSPLKLLPNRRDFDFVGFIKSATDDVRILGFSANDVLSPANVDHWKKVITTGQVRSLRILLIDPAGTDAAQRATAPCYPRAGSFGEKCKASISEIADLRDAVSHVNGSSPAVQHRTLTSNVTISMVSDSRHLLITPILWTRTGGSSPSFVLDCTDDTALEFASYSANFDALWEGATVVP